MQSFGIMDQPVEKRLRASVPFIMAAVAVATAVVLFREFDELAQRQENQNAFDIQQQVIQFLRDKAPDMLIHWHYLAHGLLKCKKALKRNYKWGWEQDQSSKYHVPAIAFHILPPSALGGDAVAFHEHTTHTAAFRPSMTTAPSGNFTTEMMNAINALSTTANPAIEQLFRQALSSEIHKVAHELCEHMERPMPPALTDSVAYACVQRPIIYGQPTSFKDNIGDYIAFVQDSVAKAKVDVPSAAAAAVSPVPTVAPKATISIEGAADMVRDTLLKEILRVEKSLKAMYPNWEEFMKNKDRIIHMHDTLVGAFLRDANFAPTFMSIFIPLVESQKAMEYVNYGLGGAPSNRAQAMKAKWLKTLAEVPDFEEHRKRDASRFKDPSYLAQRMRTFQLAADRLLHLIINMRQQGNLCAEWIYMHSQILSYGHCSQTSIDDLCKFRISMSKSLMQSHLDDAGLETFYHDRMEHLLAITRNVDRHIAVIGIDNCCLMKFAAEQTEGINFTLFTDSLTVMVNHAPLHDDFSRDPNRPSCTPLMSDTVVDGLLDFIRDGTIDFGDAMKKDGKQVVEDPKGFASLTHFEHIASIPAKSSVHEQIIQIVTMLVRMITGREDMKAEVIMPNDPEFSAFFLVLAIVFPEMMRYIIHPPAPFHFQKHAMESLLRQLIFVLLIFNPFNEYIAFKPSVFNNKLTLSIEKLSKTYLESTDAIMEQLSFEDFGETNPASEDDAVMSAEDVSAVDDSKVDSGGGEEEGEPVMIPPADENEDVSPDDLDKEILPDINRMGKGWNWTRTASTSLLQAVVGLIFQDRELRQLQVAHYDAAASLGKKASDKISMSGGIAAALKEQERIRKTMITNHCRLKYLMELLWAVVQAAEEEIKKDDLWNKNSLTKMLRHILKDILGSLCVQPFNDLNYKVQLLSFMITKSFDMHCFLVIILYLITHILTLLITTFCNYHNDAGGHIYVL